MKIAAASVFCCLGFFCCMEASAQVEPALPFPCYSYGNNNKNDMTVTGTTTFVLDDLTDFSTSQTSSNIIVTVESSQRYKLYIAGVMTAIAGSSTNTVIPLNTFTVSSSNRGTSPVTVTLSEQYQEVAVYTASTTGRTHTLTLTRNALNTFTQAPGTHTLTLHIRYCQY